MNISVKFPGAAGEVSGSKYFLQIDDFKLWLNGFKAPPSRPFIVHDEKESANALADTLVAKGWRATVPHYPENIELFKHI